MLFYGVNISYGKSKYVFWTRTCSKEQRIHLKVSKKIQMCILQQVRYSTVEYNFIIRMRRVQLCIRKISIFMTYGF